MSIDSATSESFQSSNGGADFEDFDSRPPADPISSYLNPAPPPIPQAARTIFDPFNTFLSDLSAATWPPPPAPPSLPAPSSGPNSTPALASSTSRASKKRARASRRAPTTVLTTDTSNFRAMVQEFTGIPAPPFAASSVFSRPRLDLFNHSASASTPSFLLRPFAHKRQGIGVPTSLTGISPNTLPSTAPIQNQSLFLNRAAAQNPSLGLQSLVQDHHRGMMMAPCQWPAGGGYSGGDLGSVIAGTASADADSNRIGSCKTDHTEPSHSEKQKAAAEDFSPARGEAGVDAWQLSSD